MNLFAELMEFLPASGAINLPVGQQCAIWNRILSSVGAPIIPPVKFRARPFARPCDFISQGVTGLSRSNRSATIHDADRRSTNDEDTNEGEWVDNRFAAARNLSWTGHYADQRRASIGGVSFRARMLLGNCLFEQILDRFRWINRLLTQLERWDSADSSNLFLNKRWRGHGVEWSRRWDWLKKISVSLGWDPVSD